MATAERVWANHCLSILWAERGGPPTLPLADALMGELEAFRVTLTAKGHDTYAAQSGQHDDLVIAVALAVWGGVTMSA